MDTPVKLFLEESKKHNLALRNSRKDFKETDLFLVTRKVEKSVEAFLQGNNLISGPIKSTEAVVANEAFSPELISSQIGHDAIANLVREAGVPEQYVAQAVEQLGIIMHRHVGQRNPMGVWANQTMSAASVDNRIAPMNLSDMYPESIVSEFKGRMAPSEESFGVNINMAIPDMKLAITVALMRFHTGLTPRVLPVRGTSEPMIQYIKSHMEIYDLGDVDKKPSRLLDLYKDPTPVRNELQKVVPLKANDGAGVDEVLVADGVIKFNVKANVLKLSIDATKFGHTKINRTDILADGIKFDSVSFSLTSGATTENFKVMFPANTSRLTRPSNAKDSADRNAEIEYAVFMNKDTETAAGAASVILGAIASADEGIMVRFMIRPSANLKYGIVSTLGSMSFVSHNRATGVVSAPAQTAVDAITSAMIGYSMNAKFSEENVRKTNIAIRTHRQPFSFDIPTGRNYVYDYAIGQQNPEENAANLTKIIRIGQDDITLKAIRDTLNFVYDQTILFEGSPTDKSLDPGIDYVAGDMVRPTVYLGTLEIDKIESVRSADRPGDIKQFLLTYLTAVTEEIMIKSFYRQQLADGAVVTFKCITQGPVLGNLLGARHIHNHLNQQDTRGTDGVEYKLVLDNGIVLEVVTTTFDYMQDTIILIPVVKDAPDSVLNFGQQVDYGTVVAHYTPGLSGEASHNRLFANAREMPIVTNPVGAIISVTGVDKATWLEIPPATP